MASSTEKPSKTQSAAKPKKAVETKTAAGAKKAAGTKQAASKKPATPRVPTHDEIAQLARQYWAERGHTDGHAEQDWLRAERELQKQAS